MPVCTKERQGVRAKRLIPPLRKWALLIGDRRHFILLERGGQHLLVPVWHF